MKNITEILTSIEKSKLTPRLFLTMSLLYENENRSSIGIDEYHKSKFDGNIDSAGSKLTKLNLVDMQKIRKSVYVTTVFTLNENGIQLYEYLTTGKKGNLIK